LLGLPLHYVSDRLLEFEHTLTTLTGVYGCTRRFC